jgi:assimilatory nitrate reductase catalytic subunit
MQGGIKGMMDKFNFASCVPFGRERSGLLFRAASYEAPTDEVLASIEGLLGLGGNDVLRYADKKRGQRRAVLLVRTVGESDAGGAVARQADLHLLQHHRCGHRGPARSIPRR